MWLHMTSETHMQSLWRVFLKHIRVPVKKPWLEPFWTTPRPCCMWRRRSKRTKHKLLFSNPSLHSLSWPPLTVHFPVFFLTLWVFVQGVEARSAFTPSPASTRVPQFPIPGTSANFPMPWFSIPLLSRWQPAVFPQRTFSPKLSLGHVC